MGTSEVTRWNWPRGTAHGWIADTSGELNIPLSVLNGLKSLGSDGEWHRMLIHAPPTMLARKTAHDFPINKGQPKAVHNMAQECVRRLAKILISAIGEQTNFSLATSGGDSTDT